MSLSDEQVHKLAEHLMGASFSLADALRDLFGIEEDDLSQVDHERIDDLVFECSTCNNWYEVGEMSDSDDHDWECQSCAE